jgi:hypothetical protein
MPNDHDEGHDNGPTIEVTAARQQKKLADGGGGGGFYNFGSHDSFHFGSPFFSDGGGGGGSAPQQTPEDEGPEIVVTPGAQPDFPISLDALWQTRDQVLDFLEFDYFGFYRFEFDGGSYTLELYDYEEGEIETYNFSQNHAFTFTTPLDSNSFDIPDGVQHTGPDNLYGFDTEYY